MRRERGGPAPVPGETGAMVFRTWHVGSPRRQDAAVEAITAACRDGRWPGGGLRSYAVLTADDGAALLQIAQVADAADADAPDRAWRRDIDAAVPGIERAPAVVARLRHSTPAYGAAADARCVALVTWAFDGPGGHERLIDEMSADHGMPPAAGLISAHILVSLDGSRAFGYALWESAGAHRTAIGSGTTAFEADPPWPWTPAGQGLLSSTSQRFRPRLHVTGA